jgi:hypothetical protein
MEIVAHAFDEVVQLTRERERALDRMRKVSLIAFTHARIGWREQWRRVHKARAAYTQASDALTLAHMRLARWSRATRRVRTAVVEGSWIVS